MLLKNKYSRIEFLLSDEENVRFLSDLLLVLRIKSDTLIGNLVYLSISG